MELDQVARELGDSDRLSHVEYERVAGFSHDRRLKHQLNGLGNRHEVPGRVEVGDGEWTALGKLLPEQRHNAPAAAEHVPKSDDGVREGALRRRVVYEELTDPLRRTHDARWVHGLVSGDENKAAGTYAQRGVEDIRRSEYVHEHSLLGISLHEGDVLVGRGVEDDVRPNLREQAKDL